MPDETAEQFLQRLFESDVDADDYFARNPPYTGDRLIGAKPWWPPLSEVWAYGSEPPDDLKPPSLAPSWREAAALLDDLYEQYLAAKEATK